MNKLAMNALTTPEPTAYQQFLIDIAWNITAGYVKRATREIVLQHLLVLSLSDGLPEEITPTQKGVGNVVNSILDIIAYNEGQDRDV